MTFDETAEYISNVGKFEKKLEEKEAPDLETLMQWESEGYMEATDGCRVEPDGKCDHDKESWLLVMGLI